MTQLHSPENWGIDDKIFATKYLKYGVTKYRVNDSEFKDIQPGDFVGLKCNSWRFDGHRNKLAGYEWDYGTVTKTTEHSIEVDGCRRMKKAVSEVRRAPRSKEESESILQGFNEAQIGNVLRNAVRTGKHSYPQDCGSFIDRWISKSSQAEWDSALAVAVDDGNHKSAKSLLEHGASPDARFEDHGETMLMKACKRNDGEMVEILLANGADPDLKSQHAKPRKLDYYAQDPDIQIQIKTAKANRLASTLTHALDALVNESQRKGMSPRL